ncbi:MAG TPA: hypothetical protein PLS70_11460, partial [Acidobacteriota bacterium]|nr:hypothetical protein [Acidobacteriota bacterium]
MGDEDGLKKAGRGLKKWGWSNQELLHSKIFDTMPGDFLSTGDIANIAFQINISWERRHLAGI